MFRFYTETPRRRLGLTPMIDVVFLLLVFFMLTAQFTRDLSLPLQHGQAGDTYSGPPRLIQIGADRLRLNGQELTDAALPEAVAALVSSPDDLIVLRGDPATPLQRLVDVMQRLNAAGYTRLVLVE